MVLQCILQISSDQYYSCDITRKLPVRLSIVTINEDTGFGIVEPLDGNEETIKQYVNELEQSSSIEEVVVTFRSPHSYWTRVVHKLGIPSIYETILQSGCMTNLPIIVEGGVQEHQVLAPSREKLRDLLHLLRSRFTKVSIKQLKATTVGLSKVSLTSKQKKAFFIAFEAGYYSIPRKSSIAELCTDLGIKRVAMQERLKRAELRILSAYAENKF